MTRNIQQVATFISPVKNFRRRAPPQVLAHQQLEEKNHAQQTALRFRNSHHRRPVLSEPAHASTRSTTGAAAKAGDETARFANS
jgi:hypothetical protein